MALIQQNEHTGMKMTEVGWIPKDWEVNEIQNIAPLQRGFDLPTHELRKGKYPVIYSNGLLNYHDTAMCKAPGLVTGRSGTIGKFTFIPNIDYWPHNTTLWVTNFHGNNPLFIKYLYETVGFENFSTGTGVPTLNRNELHSYKIAIPTSPSEQRRIASVLSDTDSLIASLSRTIEKKRLVKQGAMQQLLTGKTRLKGFSGEWVEKVIGNIGKTYNGITGKTKADFGCGNARYITFLNVLNNPIIDINILERVNINFDEGQNEVRRGDLFFNTSSETPEEVGICATLKQNVEEVYLNSFCFGFRISDEDVDNQYLAYYFRSDQGRALMTMLAQGATRYNLSKDNFNKSCIVLPPTRDEQQAIANILTTMDNEIASLEAELQKYKALKQGMMQKLLTGQIRLK